MLEDYTEAYILKSFYISKSTLEYKKKSILTLK